MLNILVHDTNQPMRSLVFHHFVSFLPACASAQQQLRPEPQHLILRPKLGRQFLQSQSAQGKVVVLTFWIRGARSARGNT
jgi:hypothetical protein